MQNSYPRKKEPIIFCIFILTFFSACRLPQESSKGNLPFERNPFVQSVEVYLTEKGETPQRGGTLVMSPSGSRELPLAAKPIPKSDFNEAAWKEFQDHGISLLTVTQRGEWHNRLSGQALAAGCYRTILDANTRWFYTELEPFDTEQHSETLGLESYISATSYAVSPSFLGILCFDSRARWTMLRFDAAEQLDSTNINALRSWLDLQGFTLEESTALSLGGGKLPGAPRKARRSNTPRRRRLNTPRLPGPEEFPSLLSTPPPRRGSPSIDFRTPRPEVTTPRNITPPTELRRSGPGSPRRRTVLPSGNKLPAVTTPRKPKKPAWGSTQPSPVRRATRKRGVAPPKGPVRLPNLLGEIDSGPAKRKSEPPNALSLIASTRGSRGLAVRENGRATENFEELGGFGFEDYVAKLVGFSSLGKEGKLRSRRAKSGETSVNPVSIETGFFVLERFHSKRNRTVQKLYSDARRRLGSSHRFQKGEILHSNNMYRDRSGALRQQIDTLQLKGQGLRELDGRAIFSDGRELWWDAKSGGTFESLLNDPVKAREFIKTMTAYKGLAKNHAEMTGNPTDFYVISQFKLPQGLEKFRAELRKKGIPIIEVSSKTYQSFLRRK